ncbi:MAG: PKD domain-containing protein [Cryomorphaceae bacterium]
MMKWLYNLVPGLVILFLGFANPAIAQCELFDFNGDAVTDPVWYNCSGNNYTLNLQSPHNIGAWSIDWGDGSPIQTGASLVPPASVSHVYASAVDIYTVVFTETSTGCTVTGTLYMEEPTSASIQVPVGGVTQACAPQDMSFINSSTNTSTTTIFTWDFGDGSPQETYDHTNLGQTITHTYQQGTVDCETVVTLTAENQCNTIQGGPSQATFNPIRIWDIDDAGIGASETILCWPDNEVTFTNTTERNCLFQGNIFQRYEYWNFGDYWGLGYDSIVDWRPWPPTFPHTIEYPAIGTYQVTLLDSNICGIDAATITIEIVAPPTADATAAPTDICEGESVFFTNNSSTNATDYVWDFGDGTPLVYSGATNIEHVYQTAGDYIATLLVAVGGPTSGCNDQISIPITVRPAPEAEIAFDTDRACDELVVNFTDNSTGTLVDWEWSFGNGEVSNLQNPPTQTYSDVGAYNVVLTVEADNGCKDSDTHIVRVNESPVADFMAADVCVGAEGSFTDLSSFMAGDPVVSWAWDFGDGTLSDLQNPTHVYTTTGAFTVSLEVETATCVHDTSMTINVEPAPDSDFSPSVTAGCSPLEVTFTNESTGAVSYTWLFGDGGSTGSEDAVHTFNNFGNTDSVYTVRLVAATAFGCTDTSTMDITVFPGANSMFQTFYTPGCAPMPASFLNNSTNATEYSWDFGDGSPVSNEENPTHIYSNTTQFLQNYTVQLAAITPNGCNDTSTAVISVFPEPNFQFTLDETAGCPPFDVQFPAVSGAVSTFWTFGDGTLSNSGSPTHTYFNNTLADVVYEAELVATSAFGCVDTATAEVTVYPNPIAQFSVNLTAGCSPVTVNIENQSVLADSVLWSYGNGEVSDTLAQFHDYTFVNSTDQTVTYTIELTAFTENGCSRTFTRNVEVYPEVTADFEHPESGCSPFSFAMDNTSQNGSIYQWDFGNNTSSLAQNPIVSYTNTEAVADTFDIQLVATSQFGCEDTARSSIAVFPKPNAAIFADQTTGCSPLSVNFSNTSSTADSYLWNYGDGNTSTNGDASHEHTFISTMNIPQNYQVSLVAVSDFGCSDTVMTQVTVYPEVTANFQPEAEGCTPLSVNFVNQSFGAATYLWQFGDGNEAFQPNASHTFVNNQDTVRDFNVAMIAQSAFGCTDTAYQNVKVFPLPSIALAMENIEGCYPSELTFGNYSAGADNYEWSYGDGNTSQNGDASHQHTYVNDTPEIQTYTVTLTGTTEHGCESSESIEVDIIPQIIADVTPPEGGCSPFTGVFENNSQGAFSYLWNFGDGNTSEDINAAHTFTNPSVEDETYEVTFIARSLHGCADTLIFNIPVFGQPEANFLAAPAVQQFPNATIDLANFSAANSTAGYTWTWGDGNVTETNDPAMPEDYTYETWGEFDIMLRVGNELCFDTAVQRVRIDPPLPIAAFEGEGEGCMPLPVQFTNQSTYGVSYEWNFGDGAVSNEENPTHVYYTAGTYNVTLTVTGPGGQTDVAAAPGAVTVHPRAEAFFTVNPPVIQVPDQVFFLNLSTNASIYTWDFGDGGTSTSVSPHHFYESLGWHAVTLIANNIYNCPDTFRVDQAVRGDVDTRIAFPNAFTPSTTGPNGGHWTVDDMFNNNIFFPQYKGVEEFEMQIFNRWGELLFESRDVRQGWDGYYRGRLCQMDVYVWRVKVKFADGGELTDIGDVTLIR